MDIPAIRYPTSVRPRVCGLLARQIEDLAPLTLLHAPAGFGKTVATVHWARSMREAAEVRWVATPEPGIGHEPSLASGALWCRIAEALGGEGARLSTAGSRPSAAGSRPSAADQRPWAADGRQQVGGHLREEVERLVHGLRRPTVLVLDDYHHVTSGDLDLGLARLLEANPLLHMVVLSRRFSALDGPLVGGRTSAVIVDERMLEFTEEEARALAELYGTDDFAQVEERRKRAHGWPVVMRSVVQQLAAGSKPREITRVLARLGKQRFDTVPTVSGRRAVLAIVLCPDASLETLAETLETPYADLEAVLRELEELGIVQQSWWPDSPRYRCHAGLGDALGALARREFGPEAHAMRLKHAVELSRDKPIAAVAHLFEIGEYGAASRVFTRHFLELAVPGSGVMQLLRGLSDAVLYEYPVLAGALLLLETPEGDTPDERIEQLHQWLRARVRQQLRDGEHEPTPPLMALLAVAERMRGDDDAALRLSQHIEKRLERTPEERWDAERFTAPLLYRALGLTGLVVGDPAMAERNYRRAFEAAGRFENLSTQTRACEGLAATAAFSGDLLAAERALLRRDALLDGAVPHDRAGSHECTSQDVRTAQGDRASQGDRAARSLPRHSWSHDVLARLHIARERGRIGEAFEALQQVDAHLLKRVEQWPLLVVAETQVRHLADGAPSALEALERRRREARGGFVATRYLRCVLEAHAARLHIALGNYAEAERLLGQLPAAHPDVAVTGALLHLFTNRYAAALDAAERTSGRMAEWPPELSEPQRSLPRLRVENGLVTAAARWGLGERERAIDCFAEAGELAERLGNRLLLACIPHDALVAIAAVAREAGRIDLTEMVDRIPPNLRAETYESLTRAELRTLQSLATGQTVVQIARSLYITENTVKFHLKRIYRKLRASNRSEAVARAANMMLLPAREGESR